MARPRLSRKGMWIVRGIGTLVIILSALILPKILIEQHPIKPFTPIGVGPSPIDTPTNGNAAAIQFVTSYASPKDKDGFTVRFPGEPTVKTSTAPANGQQVTSDSYTVSNSDWLYEVTVLHYPSSVDFSDPDARLKNSLEGGAKALNATVESSKKGTFEGQHALEGVIRVVHDGKTTRNYSLMFIKDHSLYSLTAINSTQANFDAFKQTFKLID